MLIYDVGIPCRKGHTTGRYTVSRKCVQCAKDAALAWNKANPDKFRANSKKYRENHREEESVRSKNWRTKHPDRVKANNEKWQEANWVKYLGISSSWKRRNRGHVNAKTKERRLSQIQRTPKWLTDQDFAGIKKFYDLAHELSQAYGFPWHVDHIIPLQGETVSGLHVVDNLQIMPGSENSRKGNRFHGC
jgi:hypothetical protein